MNNTENLFALIRKIIPRVKLLLGKLQKLSGCRRKTVLFLENAEKLAIIPSLHKFDEAIDQRPVRYAKFLANNGYKVLFVVWQKNKCTKVKGKNIEVEKGIFQISLYSFLSYDMDYSKIERKIFYIAIPHKKFPVAAYRLRQQGFVIHYDILDDWEEHSKVEHATWYTPAAEKRIILAADFVDAAAASLMDKFSYLRKGIEVFPESSTQEESLGKFLERYGSNTMRCFYEK